MDNKLYMVSLLLMSCSRRRVTDDGPPSLHKKTLQRIRHAKGCPHGHTGTQASDTDKCARQPVTSSTNPLISQTGPEAVIHRPVGQGPVAASTALQKHQPHGQRPINHEVKGWWTVHRRCPVANRQGLLTKKYASGAVARPVLVGCCGAGGTLAHDVTRHMRASRHT